MPADASFYFSVATLSASLAGLAGLVAALRRATGLEALERYRLREIVEFAFANMLLAVSTIPVASLVGTDGVARVNGTLAILVVAAHAVVLVRRAQAHGIGRYRLWAMVAVSLDVVVAAMAALAIATGAMAAYQLTLVALLARPMAAFLLVLSRLESPD
jgi:hypothetical protein